MTKVTRYRKVSQRSRRRLFIVILALLFCSAFFYRCVITHDFTLELRQSALTSSSSRSIAKDGVVNERQRKDELHDPSSSLGVVVLLAPPRHSGSLWGIDRFCLLLRAIRSIDKNLNAHWGPYPILIAVASDYDRTTNQEDGPYTEADRQLMREWAPHSQVLFQEIQLYSGEALEPNTTVAQIQKWRAGDDGGVAGRSLGYQSMCRLWSGRLQQQHLLPQYEYYMRLDDDSLFTDRFPFDPFQRMRDENLLYAYVRNEVDRWGIDQLWASSRPFLNLDRDNMPFATHTSKGDGGSWEYYGSQPYNNFHVSKTSFWSAPLWRSMWTRFNQEHLFFKHRVGDANVHAMAIMTMEEDEWQVWSRLPYVHNSNDDPGWARKVPRWKRDCPVVGQ